LLAIDFAPRNLSGRELRPEHALLRCPNAGGVGLNPSLDSSRMLLIAFWTTPEGQLMTRKSKTRRKKHFCDQDGNFGVFSAMWSTKPVPHKRSNNHGISK